MNSKRDLGKMKKRKKCISIETWKMIASISFAG
jgi:hypothetical protein